MKYLYVFALTMRKRKSRAVKCWFFGMTAIATMKTQQLWSPALGQYRKERVISQTWAGEALTDPCLSVLNASSWFLGRRSQCLQLCSSGEPSRLHWAVPNNCKTDGPG